MQSQETHRPPNLKAELSVRPEKRTDSMALHTGYWPLSSLSISLISSKLMFSGIQIPPFIDNISPHSTLLYNRRTVTFGKSVFSNRNIEYYILSVTAITNGSPFSPTANESMTGLSAKTGSKSMPHSETNKCRSEFKM